MADSLLFPTDVGEPGLFQPSEFVADNMLGTDALMALASLGENPSDQALSSEKASSDRLLAEQISSDRLLAEAASSNAIEYQGWNPNDRTSVDFVLTDHNHTATNENSASGIEGVRATISHSTGKWYFEVTANHFTNYLAGGAGLGGIGRYLGILAGTADLTTPDLNKFAGVNWDGADPGTTMGFYFNLDDGIAGFVNPVGSANYLFFTIPKGARGLELFPYFRAHDLNDSVTLNLGLTPFVGASWIPFGAKAWQTAAEFDSGIAQDFPFWSEMDKATGLVLSNEDQTFTGTGSNQEVRSYYGHVTGKWYAVFHNISAPGSNIGVGLADPSRDLTAGTSSSANVAELVGYGGVSISGNGYSAFSSGVGSISDLTGHDVEMAVDIERGKIWFRLDGAGNWNGSDGTGTTDPATGVGGLDMRSPLAWPWTELFVWGSAKTAGDTASVVLDGDLLPSSLSFAPPTGFAWWNDPFNSSEAVSEQASSSNKILHDAASSDHAGSHLAEEASSSNALLSDAQASDRKAAEDASSSNAILAQEVSSDRLVAEQASSSDHLLAEEASSSNAILSDLQASDIKAAKDASSERAASDAILAQEVSSDRLANRPPPVQVVIISAN